MNEFCVSGQNILLDLTLVCLSITCYSVIVSCPLLRILLPESQVDLINTAMFSTAILTLLLSFATATTATLCNIDPPQQCPWYNANNTDEQRITLLVGLNLFLDPNTAAIDTH